MLEKTIIEQAAPTLAGVKPANLFPYWQEDMSAVWENVKKLNKGLEQRGLSVAILKHCKKKNRVLLYVYRKNWLLKLLAQPAVQDFLEKEGYQRATEIDAYLDCLSERLCLEEAFPHEIGIFLGYPLADVIGFIDNRGQNYLCCGLWKVYDNPDLAQRMFAQFRKCTQIYKRMFESGSSLLQLTVVAT